MKKPVKILVTGATGFIGRHVIRNLLQIPDIEIIATALNLDEALHLDFFSRVKFIEVDLSVKDENIFQKLMCPDIMIHLAWYGLPNYNGLFHIEKNLFENFIFMKNMIFSGLKNICVTGTCFEYGMIEGRLSEDMATLPSNSYGIAKDSLRKFIEVLLKEYSFSFKWLRLFYMYGEGQSPNSLISLLDQAIARGDKEFNMSGGEQLRDYLHVEKVADYIVKCSLQTKISGIINCCSGVPVAVKDFVKNYLSERNYNINLNLGFYPYPDYEPMALVLRTA